VQFCSKHSLSPSVKAGGYGTAGWAIGGDIIIDVSKLLDIDIEPPNSDGSFTSLRDVAPANSKGKKPQQALPSPAAKSAKRRREDDSNLRDFDAASTAVGSFLRGPPLPPITSPNDGPSPSVRRRTEGPSPSSSGSNPVYSAPAANTATPAISRELSGSSLSESQSGDSMDSREQSMSTLGTTPSPPPAADIASFPTPSNPTSSLRPANSSSDANPFGYLDNPSNFPPAPPPTALQSNYHQNTTSTLWSVSSASVLANTSGLFGQVPLPAHAVPIHPHAYVTFGSGMRQKEVDTFTAKNKLEATYLTGNGDGIPYHVPL